MARHAGEKGRERWRTEIHSTGAASQVDLWTPAWLGHSVVPSVNAAVAGMRCLGCGGQGAGEGGVGSWACRVCQLGQGKEPDSHLGREFEAGYKISQAL